MPRLVFDIKPVPKPRETQRDKWNPRTCVKRFRCFRDEVIIKAVNKAKYVQPVANSRIIFVVPMPKSWTKKKKAEMEGTGHQQRPDVDNFLKAWLDSVCKEGDEHIYDVRPTKIWGRSGRIVVEYDSPNDN